METPLLTIDFNNFVLGESITQRTPDKGFSPQSYGINLTYEKGTLYFQETVTDRSTNLEGDIVCTTNDPEFLGNDNYILDDEGKFYTLSGASLTKRQTDAVMVYQVGTSDMIKYRGNTLATSQTDVALLGGDNLTSIDHDWWSVTRGHGSLQTGYRHPLEIVEDILYIGDKNYIHTWDNGTSVYQAMALPDGINIITLRKHPDGRHLIAFCGITANYSHTRSGGGKIYIIDTVNLEFIREIDTEAQVEGSRNVGGVVYVTYGDKLGYFNGDGISWLRDLTAGSTTYSHQLANAEDILLVRDGIYLLAYGDLGQGKVWWRPHATQAGSYVNFTAVGYKGNGVVLVCYKNGTTAVETLEELNIRNVGINGIFLSNHSLAGQNIAIRRIEVDHTKTPASGINAFNLYVFNGVGDQLHFANTSYTDNPTSTSRIDLDAFTDDLQLMLTPSNGAMGFRQIRVYGESIE